MSQLCHECGVSRKTGYKWVERYKEEGVKGLSNKSRAPTNPSRKYEESQINLALELKQKKPRYGPKKILAILKRKYPVQEWPSATRLYEIFKEHHLVCSRKLKRRVPKTHPLAEINNSNDVWCADFKGWFMSGDQSKVEPFTVTDAFSRFIIKCLHLERKRAEDVWKVLSDAFYEYGIPKRIRTDNGPPFATTSAGRLSKLSVNLIKAGVIPEWITPGHPEENGRHERFHKSLKNEIANPPAATFEEQVQRMSVFVDEFNFERPHEALNQQVPGGVYEPSSTDWNGVLRPPEYNTKEMIIRKVGPSGCFNWKRVPSYVGTVLSGEYIGLKEFDDNCFRVYYGPIYLGLLLRNGKFEKPKIGKDNNTDCYPC